MENSPRPCSPFLPLQLLVTFLCIWMAYQVFNLNEARKFTKANLNQVTPLAEAGETAKKRLLDLAQDLLQLAPKSQAATDIVKEFDIHLVTPPSSPAQGATK